MTSIETSVGSIGFVVVTGLILLAGISQMLLASRLEERFPRQTMPWRVRAGLFIFVGGLGVAVGLGMLVKLG